MKQIILTDKQAAQLAVMMEDCLEHPYYVALASSVLDQLAEQSQDTPSTVAGETK